MNNEKCASAAGRELYHAIWQAVGEHFYDEKKLAGWATWEHRFDDVIAGDETAIRLAGEAIASLGDPYTRLRVKTQATAASETGDSPGNAPPAESGGERIENVTAVVTGDGIGYLRILSFYDAGVVDEVEAALAKIAGCNGLILDLRHNPGGLMSAALDCCELFLRSGTLSTVETRTQGGIARRTTRLTPEACLWIDESPDGKTETQAYKRRKPLAAGKPIAILLSGITASSTELFTCAVVVNGFRGGCLTIGKTTLGKGIGQSEWIDVLGRAELRISSCRWLAPTGDWLGDGAGAPNGIEPDIVVPDDHGPEGLEVAAREVRKMVESLRLELQAIKSRSSSPDTTAAS